MSSWGTSGSTATHPHLCSLQRAFHLKVRFQLRLYPHISPFSPLMTKPNNIRWYNHRRSKRLLAHIDNSSTIRHALFSDSRSEAQAEGQEMRTNKVSLGNLHQKLADVVFMQGRSPESRDTFAVEYQTDSKPFVTSLVNFLTASVPHFFFYCHHFLRLS